MITQILAKVLPVLVMIALGRVCATKGILNDDQHAGLKNIIGDILLPVVLFQAFFTHGMDRVLQIQPVTAVYHAPKGRDPRFYGWWGDMHLGPHLLAVLAQYPQGVAPDLTQILPRNTAGPAPRRAATTRTPHETR